MSFTMSLVCSAVSAASAVFSARAAWNSARAASQNFDMQKAIKKRQEKLEQEKRKEFKCNVFKLYSYTNFLLKDLKTFDEKIESLKTIDDMKNPKKSFELDQASQKIREDYNCVVKTIKILSLGPTHSAASFKEADLIFEIQDELPKLTYQSDVDDFKLKHINAEDLNKWCMNTIKKIKDNFDFIK